jgi:hypothetical protein
MRYITIYYLSLIGAQAGELALKADAPLTHDLISTLQLKPKTSKIFLHHKLLYPIFYIYTQTLKIFNMQQ